MILLSPIQDTATYRGCGSFQQVGLNQVPIIAKGAAESWIRT